MSAARPVREYRLAEDVIPIVDQLPEKEAAKLVQHQVGQMSSLDLADLIRAIALRVERGRDPNEGSGL